MSAFVWNADFEERNRVAMMENLLCLLRLRARWASFFSWTTDLARSDHGTTQWIELENVHFGGRIQSQFRSTSEPFNWRRFPDGSRHWKACLRQQDKNMTYSINNQNSEKKPRPKPAQETNRIVSAKIVCYHGALHQENGTGSEACGIKRSKRQSRKKIPRVQILILLEVEGRGRGGLCTIKNTILFSKRRFSWGP